MTGGGHANPLQYSCLKNPHGQRSLAGYSPWSCKELDTTEQLSTAQHAKSNNSDRERQLLYDITVMCYLKNTTN